MSDDLIDLIHRLLYAVKGFGKRCHFYGLHDFGRDFAPVAAANLDNRRLQQMRPWTSMHALNLADRN